MTWRSGREVFDVAGSLSDTTDANAVSKWSVGVGLAAALALYSIFCFWTGRALFPRSRPMGFIEVQGLSATAVASLYLSVAVFAHLHLFWTSSPRFWGYAQLGKMIAATGIVASLMVYFFSALLG